MVVDVTPLSVRLFKCTFAAFIERRQKGLERFLRRLTEHPLLVTDDFVHMFFETDQKIPKSGSSYFSTMSKALTTYFETDEFFDDRMRQADVLESQLKRLHKAIESLVSVRKNVSVSTTKFAETFAALADAEVCRCSVVYRMRIVCTFFSNHSVLTHDCMYGLEEYYTIENTVRDVNRYTVFRYTFR